MKGFITSKTNTENNQYILLGTVNEKNVVADKECCTQIEDSVAIAFEGTVFGITDCPDADIKNPIKDIAKLYQSIGTKAFEKINGSFAILVVDFVKQAIMLVRDHVGLSSFYYCKDKDTFTFSTDYKWMMQNVPNKTINTNALFQYMHHLYVLAPETIVKEIVKVQPASYVSITKDGEAIEKYWDVEQKYFEGQKNQIPNFEDAKSQLVDLIRDAVSIRYQPTKTGIMLSSGIDSSLVTAISSELYKEEVETLTIGIDDKKLNESEIAKQIADHLGICNTTLWMDYATMENQIGCIVDACPELMGDYGAIPNIFITQQASQKYEYVMGGDGGDEVFSGYPHYEIVDKAQKYDFHGGVLRLLLPRSIQSKLPTGVRRVLENRDKHNKTLTILQSEVEQTNKLLKTPFAYIGDSMENPHIKSWRERRMVHDIQTSLVDEMVYKAVCCANYAGVKVLSPLLDYRVLELSFRIPLKYKYKDGITKHILRQIDYDYIPQQILDVPKRGFVLPIEMMLKNQAPSIERYINREYLDKQNLFNYFEMKKVYHSFLEGDKSMAKTIWNFLTFQMWYEKYMCC